ncbi:UNVERIFIED_CONTAM: hypothetical protein RMT77_016264 [Armadillidium vulgare]
MNSYKVTPVSPPMQLGEGPHWIEKDQSLLFVDHPAGVLNRLYTQTGRHQVLDLDVLAGPSVAIPVEGQEDKFVVGLKHDLVLVEWGPNDPDYKKCKSAKIHSFDEHHPKNALNDAKCDPLGRLWIGSKGSEEVPGIIEPKKGTLFRVDSSLEVSEQVKEVTLSNGLTWSLDGKIFYYIDTPTLSVDAFDYDLNTGNISNRRVVYDMNSSEITSDSQYPDGMTIDNDGNLWVGCYNGAKVICIDPSVGKIVRKVDIPSLYTTSCCFGGKDYSILFVTSANRGLSDEEVKLQPESGKTFAVSGLGVKGSPHRNFKINDDSFKKLLSRSDL